MKQQSILQKTKQKVLHKQHVPNNKLLHNLIVESESHCSRVRPEYLNSFFYNDHITSAQLAINRDLMFVPTSKIRYSHKDNLNQGSCSTIKQCFDLMKSTRRFHLNSIQARNYGAKCKIIRDQAEEKSQDNQGLTAQNRRQKYYRNKKQQKENYLKQKNTLSKMLSHSSVFSTIQNNSKQECSDKEQEISTEPTNNNDKQVQQNKQQKQNNQKCEKKQVKLKNNLQTFNIKKQNLNKNRNNLISYQNLEKQAMNIANSQLRYFLRKNGQFLVTPKLAKRDKHHQMTKSLSFNQTYIQKGKNKQKIDWQSTPQQTKYFDKQQLGQYLFKQNGNDKLERKLRMTYIQKGQNKHKNSAIISAIQKGNYSKVQIQLSFDPLLLRAKQPKNLNNLLHVCIMNNKQDIFLMILRKCRKRGIDLLVEKNKYGRSPLELGKILSFFKEKQLLNQMSEIQQERIRSAYHVISDILGRK